MRSPGRRTALAVLAAVVGVSLTGCAGSPEAAAPSAAPEPTVAAPRTPSPGAPPAPEPSPTAVPPVEAPATTSSVIATVRAESVEVFAAPGDPSRSAR